MEFQFQRCCIWMVADLPGERLPVRDWKIAGFATTVHIISLLIAAMGQELKKAICEIKDDTMDQLAEHKVEAPGEWPAVPTIIEANPAPGGPQEQRWGHAAPP